MWSLEITKENLDNQRNAVQEERRSASTTSRTAGPFEAIDELAYDNFAYAHSVIGSMDDLNAASVEDVASFFKTYYAPNNAVLAIVGDVKTGRGAREGPQVLRVDPVAAPAAAGGLHRAAAERRKAAAIDDPLARAAAHRHRLHDAAGAAPDDDALRCWRRSSASGRSSRFYENLVRQQALTSGVPRVVDRQRRGPGLFRVGATALPGKSIGRPREGRSTPRSKR